MHSRRWILAGAAASAAAACARPLPPPTVFAAASLREVLSEAGSAWAGRAPGPRFSFGASSAMARQIAQGAPADLFVSADEAWMDWLAARGLIAQATRRDLCGNRLALIAPAAGGPALSPGPGMPLAEALGEGRLALADPDAVPAGRYARASLAALGAWPSVEDRLLPAESVRAALAYVARGEAPLGIVYATDARAEPRVRTLGLLPASSHPPIVYPAALTTASRNGGAADFLAWLEGRQAAALFRRHGFTGLA
ncbi:MAG: molybdate ABC transporter substrate-binding protein [Pseudomonadota bacterium]